MTQKPLVAFLTLALALSVGCGGDSDAANPQPQSGPGTPPAGDSRGAPASSANGGGSTAAPGGDAQGGGGNRTAASITLAATDVHVVKRGEIEEGVSLTGDLRPIETVEIRARVEGDLVGVFVREGEQVRAGQVLARFEDSEQSSNLISAQADKLAAQSELTTATWNLEQTTELFKAGAVAERDFKLAQQTEATAKARLAAADARVRAATSLMNDTRATATTSGVISRRAVENGERISRGTSMFTLVRTNVLELAAAVPARFAGGVRVGQTVSFTADGRSFDGKVARVSPTVDPSTRSVTVYVQVPNPQEALKGGTFASGKVVSRVITDAVVIPVAAVRLTADGQQFVYRIAGTSVDLANVQIGLVDERGGIAEVRQGVSEGDRLIVGNVGTLGRGMQVVIAGGEAAPSGRPGRPPAPAARQ